MHMTVKTTTKSSKKLNKFDCKVESTLKGAWIWFHHLHLKWKFKLLSGKFAWGVKAKHCFNKLWHHTAMCGANFSANNLNFHWRWRWWDQIQTIFLNLFYFIRNVLTLLHVTQGCAQGFFIQISYSVLFW